MRTVAHLPYDVLLDIFTHLSSHDLVHLLCTCRTLYNLVGDEGTWRSLSAPYGLRDISYFGGRSWYTIYTRLLHTYGPMMGIWAGDHPYTGGIIELTLQPGDPKTPGGIVVDMWRFRILQPEDLDGPEMPELPAYTRLARIDFTTTQTLYQAPTFTCCCDKHAPPHRAWLHYWSHSFQGFHLHARQGTFPHPDFPGEPLHPWIDDARYPRLSHLPSRETYQATHLRPRPRVPIVYTAPSPYRKPPALSMSCALGCIERTRPFLGFEDISQSLPRFYPLRLHAPAYIVPTSPEWQPQSLTGVWLGSHGPHGTECLFVEWVGHSGELRAWKITGDENVPRGALSWQADLKSPYRLSEAHRALCAGCLGGALEGYRLYPTSGTISGRGFMPHHRDTVTAILAIGPEPPLRVIWIDEGVASAYIRYSRRV
ncbi:hypothetical protein C8Q78DRAFT_969733 [Trametes maxima]|nr:hypothetical protein C8Q78DRAFT_969733 [Trametes maxima]